MQLRNSGVGVVACSPKEPQNPVKPLGSLSGGFSSPRLATKMRLGVSAKIPPVDPQMYPGLAYASGCGQFGTTSYGPVRSSPPFSWSDAGAVAYPTPTTASSESRNMRMRTLPLTARGEKSGCIRGPQRGCRVGDPVRRAMHPRPHPNAAAALGTPAPAALLLAQI